MTEARANPFWTYSLSLYGRPQVADACLVLQDRLGLDVNFLLFCCWAGSQGRFLRGSEIENLIAATQAWRENMVLPLRRARRWLKSRMPEMGSAAPGLRENIKACELAAEAIQQDMMHETLPLPGGASSPGAAAANLRAYAVATGAKPSTADLEALATLLGEAHPGLARTDAQELLARR